MPLFQVTDITIKRGIVTGSNEIFTISDIKKNEICKQDSKSIEIMKPVFRGKNIKRYFTTPPDEWLIFTRRGINIENYPAIKKYLLKYKDKLTPGVGRKHGTYKWYEIQDNIAYFKDFEKEKIIWPQLSSQNSFTISANGEYSLNSTTIATGKNLKYYCAILNSKAVLFYFKLGSVIWGKDGIKWFGDFFDHIPIPNLPETEQKPLIALVNKIIEQKKMDSKADTSTLENEIDEIVYKIYNFNENDIKIVNQNLKH
jgi:hypothetical protein